jgi:hypothetical protein
MGELLADGQIVVVETEEDVFLGTAEVSDGHVVVRSGYVGRPVVLPLPRVRRVTPADEHPDTQVSPDDAGGGAAAVPVPARPRG